MACTGKPPNFDALYGKGRFSFTIARTYLRDGRHVADFMFADYATGRGFVARYFTKGVTEKDAESDLRKWADKMGENDMLVSDEGTIKQDRYPYAFCWPPTYDKLPDELRVVSTPISDLRITGAITPRVLVVGDWLCTYARLQFYGDQEAFDTRLSTLLKVQRHPYVLPIARIIIDKEDNVIGLTQPFLTGGDLSTRMVIKTKWILQLLQLMDDLETEYKILHGDLHPGNILIHPKDDNVRVIDWESAADTDPAYTSEYGHDTETDRDTETASAVLCVFCMLTKLAMPVADVANDELMSSTRRLQTRAELAMTLEWEPKCHIDSPIGAIKDLLVLWSEARTRSNVEWPTFFTTVRECIPELFTDGYNPLYPHQSSPTTPTGSSESGLEVLWEPVMRLLSSFL